MTFSDIIFEMFSLLYKLGLTHFLYLYAYDEPLKAPSLLSLYALSHFEVI